MKSYHLMFLARVALVLSVVIIFCLSVIRTGPDLPGGLSDKFYHTIAFLILSCLAGTSFPKTGSSFYQPVVLLLYGIVIEVVQYFLPYRSFSIADMVADAGGIFVYHFIVKLFLMNQFFTNMKKGN